MAKTNHHNKSSMGGILKMPDALRRDLVLLVVAKLALMAALYVLFFSPTHRPAINAVAHIAGTLP